MECKALRSSMKLAFVQNEYPAISLNKHLNTTPQKVSRNKEPSAIKIHRYGAVRQTRRQGPTFECLPSSRAFQASC